MTEEVTLFYEGEKPSDYIILHSYRYRPGLTIYDQDKSSLGLFPNETVRKLLQNSTDKKKASELLEDMNTHRKYVTWISLPAHNQLSPNRIRVISFTYTDDEEPGRSFDSFSKLIFNIPEFDVEKTTPSSENFPTTITVIPPDGFRVKVEQSNAQLTTAEQTRNLERSDHYYLTKAPTIIDANIPHSDDGEIRFSMRYSINPEKSEQKALLSFIAVLLLISTAIFVSAIQVSFNWPLPKTWLNLDQMTLGTVKSKVGQIGAAVVLISLGFVGLATNPLTHRTRYWAALALGLTTIGLLLATS